MASLVETKLICQTCGERWVENTIADVPIDVWIKYMKSLYCKHCGAGWKQLSVDLGSEVFSIQQGFERLGNYILDTLAVVMHYKDMEATMTKLILKIKPEPANEIGRTLALLSGDLAVVAKIDGRSDTSKLPDSLIVVECPAVEVRALTGNGTPTVDYPRQVPAEYARFFLRSGPLYCDDLELNHCVLTNDERAAIIASLRERDRRSFDVGKGFGTQIAEARK